MTFFAESHLMNDISVFGHLWNIIYMLERLLKPLAWVHWQMI